MSKQVEPQVVMAFLNQLFTVFDKLLDAFGVQKVETAGKPPCFPFAISGCAPNNGVSLSWHWVSCIGYTVLAHDILPRGCCQILNTLTPTYYPLTYVRWRR